jgi:hypothetical protein
LDKNYNDDDAKQKDKIWFVDSSMVAVVGRFDLACLGIYAGCSASCLADQAGDE